MKKTPFEKAGYKPNDVFVVIKDADDSVSYYKEGEIAMLYKDDGSECPLFYNDNEFMVISHTCYIYLNNLQKIGTL